MNVLVLDVTGGKRIEKQLVKDAIQKQSLKQPSIETGTKEAISSLA